MMASVMPAMAIISLVPVLPLLGREFGRVEGAAFLVPIALTVPALCVALFSPLAGWVSDRAGRKWLLVASLLVYAVIGIIPFWLKDLVQIIGTRVVLGVAEAFIMTVATAMIADYFKGDRREKWVSAQVGVVAISAIILIAVGGALGQALGSRGPFLMYLLAIPIALLVTLFLFEPERREQVSGQTGKLPLARILPLLGITLIVGVMFYTTIVKLGAILGLTGEVSAGQIGIIGAFVNAGVVGGAILFSRIKQASGPLLLVIGMGLFTLGYAGMGLSGGVYVTSGFAIVAALGAGLLLPTLLNWVLQILPEAVRGRGTGLWTGMFFLGQFVAPILVSAVQTSVGGLANVLLIWAVVAGLGLLLALLRVRGAPPLTQIQPGS
jgi:MFS family permease